MSHVGGGCVMLYLFPLHRRAKCKCHSFQTQNKFRVLLPNISLTFVNVVAMAPGCLFNAQCTFAEIGSISLRREKNCLICRMKGHCSCYFWGALTENGVQNNKLRRNTAFKYYSVLGRSIVVLKISVKYITLSWLSGFALVNWTQPTRIPAAHNIHGISQHVAGDHSHCPHHIRPVKKNDPLQTFSSKCPLEMIELSCKPASDQL